MLKEDMDAWYEAQQQACAIAMNKEFESPEAYLDFVIKLSEELYEYITKGN